MPEDFLFRPFLGTGALAGVFFAEGEQAGARTVERAVKFQSDFYGRHGEIIAPAFWEAGIVT